MNPTVRLPVSAIGAVLFTGIVFYFLWAMVHGIGGGVQLKPAVKIEFTPLRKDTQAESKRDKIERPKPGDERRRSTTTSKILPVSTRTSLACTCSSVAKPSSSLRTPAPPALSSR